MPDVPDVPATPAVPFEPLTPLVPELEFTYPTNPVVGLYVTTYGPACTGKVCSIRGCEDPEITSEPVITAEPEKGNPTLDAETYTVTPVVSNVVNATEPEKFKKGTLALTSVPFW